MVPVKLFTIPGLKGTPKYQAFYGESTGNMVGGFIGEVAYPTSDDIKKAKTERENLEEVLNTTLLTQIPKDFKIVDGARIIRQSARKSMKMLMKTDNSEFSAKRRHPLSFSGKSSERSAGKTGEEKGGEDFDLRSSTLEYGIVRADFAKRHFVIPG